MIAPLMLTAALLVPVSSEDATDNKATFYANGRLRAETIQDPPDGPDRNRGRLRFRAGGSYDLSENVRFEARISTLSDGDANNPHWDFGDGTEGLAGADLVLDRMYLSWTPRPSLTLLAGRFAHPFSRPPVFGEFVWDSDLSTSGAGAIWRPGPESLDLRLAAAIVQENPAGNDAKLLGIQANYDLNVGHATTAHLASGIHLWDDTAEGSYQNQGNTSLAGEFAISDSILTVTHEGGFLNRQKGYFQFIQNIEDETGVDTGFTAGFEMGTGEPDTTTLLFTYFDLEANSIFSPVGQDLTPIPGSGAGTGMNGFLAGFRHDLSENTTLRLLFLTTDAGLDDDPYRVVLDLDFNML